MAVETSFRKDAIFARCFLTYSGWGEGLKVWGGGLRFKVWGVGFKELDMFWMFWWPSDLP